MQTIYMEVLKGLVKEELAKLTGNLIKQTKGFASFFHTEEVSNGQKAVILKLDSQIVEYQSTGDDVRDSKNLSDLIEKTRVAVRSFRNDKNCDKKKSDTLEFLDNLKNYVTNFADKLSSSDFKFNFLNLKLTNTPEGLFYQHMIKYIGKGVFDHDENKNPDVRKKKELAVDKRCFKLNDYKNTNDFELRKARTLESLDELQRDNKMIVSEAKGKVSIPIDVTFGVIPISASITKPWSPKKGSLEVEINEAREEIQRLSARNFVVQSVEQEEEQPAPPENNDDDEPTIVPPPSEATNEDAAVVAANP